MSSEILPSDPSIEMHHKLLSINRTFTELVSEYNHDRISREEFFARLEAQLQDIPEPEFKNLRLYGYKVNRRDLSGPLWELWQALGNPSSGASSGKNEKHGAFSGKIKDDLIYDDKFIQLFFTVIWTTLRVTGIATQNISDFLDQITDIIRHITAPDYIIVHCDNPDRYYCGRALITIQHGKSRLLLFESDADGSMNQVIIDRYMGIEDQPGKEYEPGMPEIPCGLSKRVMKELAQIRALPYVTSMTYLFNDDLTLKVTTNCGCGVKLTIPCKRGTTIYPHIGPEIVHINDISYTHEWTMATKLVDIIDRAHKIACVDGVCKTFSLRV